jgi:Arm domain-containing DNA-binding protein
LDPRSATRFATRVPGLVLSVLPSGLKQWTLRYRTQGKRRRLILGAFGDFPKLTLSKAREAAENHRPQIREGADPGAVRAAAKAIPLDTVGALVKEYTSKRVQVRHRRADEEERILDVYVLPATRQASFSVARSHAIACCQTTSCAGSGRSSSAFPRHMKSRRPVGNEPDMTWMEILSARSVRHWLTSRRCGCSPPSAVAKSSPCAGRIWISGCGGVVDDPGRGVPRQHISAVLSHVEAGPIATRVYDRYSYDAEKRAALETWANELSRILSDKPKATRAVVPMKKRA